MSTIQPPPIMEPIASTQTGKITSSAWVLWLSNVASAVSTYTVGLIKLLAASTVSSENYGQSGIVGTSTNYAREDHAHGMPNQYTLPTATTTVLGGVKIDGTTVTIASGVISATKDLTAQTGILQGNGTSITASAVYNVNGNITGTGALTFQAGGTNQAVSLIPTGTGAIDIGTNTVSGLIPTAIGSQNTVTSPQGLAIGNTNVLKGGLGDTAIGKANNLTNSAGSNTLIGELNTTGASSVSSLIAGVSNTDNGNMNVLLGSNNSDNNGTLNVCLGTVNSFTNSSYSLLFGSLIGSSSTSTIGSMTIGVGDTSLTTPSLINAIDGSLMMGMNSTVPSFTMYPASGGTTRSQIDFGYRASSPHDADYEWYSTGSGANIAHFHSTNAQSTSGGAILSLNAVPVGAAISSGNRLGSLQFGGSKDNAQTLGVGPTIESYTTQNWTSTTLGCDLEFKTIPNGSTTRTLALTLGQDQSAKFANSILLNGGTNNTALVGYREGVWTPSPTNLTVIGTPTYTGTYTRIGNIVKVLLTISATSSTASTAGATSFTGLPYTPAYIEVCMAANNGIQSYGNGVVSTSGQIFTPTWAATAAVVNVSFTYQTSSAF